MGMTPADIEALEALLEKATPGPWLYEIHYGEGHFSIESEALGGRNARGGQSIIRVLHTGEGASTIDERRGASDGDKPPASPSSDSSPDLPSGAGIVEAWLKSLPTSKPGGHEWNCHHDDLARRIDEALEAERVNTRLASKSARDWKSGAELYARERDKARERVAELEREVKTLTADRLGLMKRYEDALGEAAELRKDLTQESKWLKRWKERGMSDRDLLRRLSDDIGSAVEDISILKRVAGPHGLTLAAELEKKLRGSLCGVRAALRGGAETDASG